MSIPFTFTIFELELFENAASLAVDFLRLFQYLAMGLNDMDW